MIAEAIKRNITTELNTVRSIRDIRRLFDSAETDFERRNVPAHRRKQVLIEIRRDLPLLLSRDTDPNSHMLIAEAQILIDQMLRN